MNIYFFYFWQCTLLLQLCISASSSIVVENIPGSLWTRFFSLLPSQLVKGLKRGVSWNDIFWKWKHFRRTCCFLTLQLSRYVQCFFWTIFPISGRIWHWWVACCSTNAIFAFEECERITAATLLLRILFVYLSNTDRSRFWKPLRNDRIGKPIMVISRENQI